MADTGFRYGRGLALQLAKWSSRIFSRSSSRVLVTSGSPPGSATDADGPEPLPRPPRVDDREPALERDDHLSALANFSRDMLMSSFIFSTSTSSDSSSEETPSCVDPLLWPPTSDRPVAAMTGIASPCRALVMSGNGTSDDPALTMLSSEIGSGLQPVG